MLVSESGFWIMLLVLSNIEIILFLEGFRSGLDDN